MGFLPQVQRKIINDRYGLTGEIKTLQTIGKEIGITSERVRQIQRAAEKRLRDWMND
jgi:DNA-directed RNA polymerase sigma subunit (sigma70/sigma32)